MRKKTLGLALIIFAVWSVFIAPRRSVLADESPSRFDAAVSLYYSGKVAESTAMFSGIVEKDPTNDAARLNLIRLQEESGDYPSAIAQLNILIGRRPENAGLYRAQLIKLLVLAGQPDAAAAVPLPDDPSAEELYWRGLALIDLGNTDDALDVITASLIKQPFNPMANLIVGRLILEQGNNDVARNFLRRALTQEPNLSAALYPLAQAEIGLGNYETAQNLLRNAAACYPWDTKITDALKKLEADHPELAAQAQQKAERKLQYTMAPAVEPAPSRDGIPEIRIGLAEKVRQFSVKTGDRFTLSAPDSAASYSGDPATVLCLRRTDGGVEAVDEKGATLFKSGQSIVLTYANPGATTVLFDVELGPGNFWAGHVDRAYRGRMDFLAKPSGLTIVNQVNIEEYLYSVVPSEIPHSWPAESLKSQAVAARTYALANLGQFAARGFDLLSTTASQVYSGIGTERPETRQAVDETCGQILTYQGRPINAFFSDNNGGYSESPREIWGFDAPYLQSVADPMLSLRTKPLPPADLTDWLNQRPLTTVSNPKYSSHSAYRWVQWVSREEVEYRLGMGDQLGSVVSVTVVGRTISGRATRVLVKGTRGEVAVSADMIRKQFGGLRSNLFVVEPKMGKDGLPAYFIFTGGGWGHGIGLSQSGAARMAANHDTAEQILSHYYPGAVLTKKY